MAAPGCGRDGNGAADTAESIRRKSSKGRAVPVESDRRISRKAAAANGDGIAYIPAGSGQRKSGGNSY
jgi:hypothetical protein